MTVQVVKNRWYVKVMHNGVYYTPIMGYNNIEDAVKASLELKNNLGPGGKIRETLYPQGQKISFKRNYHRQRALQSKILVMEHYARNGKIACACCGEDRLAFLTMDHIKNNGEGDRKKFGSGTGFYNYLIRNNFPEEFELQILCFNCNCGKRVNGGICPHKENHQEQLPGVVYAKLYKQSKGKMIYRGRELRDGWKGPIERN